MSQEELNNLSEYVVPDGMPKSVFENKYSRRKPDGTMQTYAERMREVVAGNFMMDPTASKKDYETTLDLAVRGIMPTAGRHIQHGDTDQPNKIMELHTNCSTAAFSFMLMRLLLRGSGVGRDYSSACCRVNWDNMPDVRLVLDEAHPDFAKTGMYGWVETLRDAKHKYDSSSENTRWFTVDDSREGWSKVVEILETAAWQEKHKNKLFIFDFSQVRPEGAPIMGLQGRPASGPLAFMKAMSQVASIKGGGMKPWKQALFIDHYIASAIAWGGARRAARMATKSWRDRDVIEFIDIKRGGFLWSANNSILVDAEFWAQAREPRPSYARRIFEAAVGAAYWDATGEPGFINVDRLNTNKEGLEKITGATLINEKVYTDLHHKTKEMIDNVVEHIKQVELPFITNPCSEIVLSSLGGYCVSGNTRILHKDGYSKIEDLVGKSIEVFNGYEWSAVTPFKTGEGQPLVRITLSDGSQLDCTPYHRFAVRRHRQGTLWDTKTANELRKGDILPTFRVPFDTDGTSEPEAYTYGAFLGDGGIERRKDTGNFRFTISLYAGKHHLPVSGSRGSEQTNTGIDVTVSHLDQEKLFSLKEPSLPEWVFGMNRASTIEFIKGWMDTDGAYHKGVGGISITTAEEGRARDLHLLMRRIGMSYSSVRKVADVGDMTNFGPRNKPLWSVYVPASEASMLNAHRVKTDYEQNLEHVVKQPRVVSVVPLDGVHDTFCFTEPVRGMGVFGNMLTYQCVIGDINLARANTMAEADDAAAMMAKFLIRVNLMQSEYAAEVARTNRIGVSLTGIHEFAYRLFGLTFYDLIGYYDALESGLAESHKAHKFWMAIDGLRNVAELSAAQYSERLGMVTPHTVTTIKPSGTVSKVMNCTEGAHLPALAHYIRWVQFKIGDADIDSLRAAGYPFKDISHRYSGHVAIGFPTKQPIVDLMGDKVVTADETTPEENFKWLCLLERFWLGTDNRNNQVSYTLKYDSRRTSYTEFMDMILKWQPDIRCCSVMPSSDWQETEKVYGYVPEQPITADEYEELMLKINPVEKEAYDDESLMCEGGACPIEFDINR